MDKLNIVGTICAMGVFWVGLLCATLQCCFHVDGLLVAYIGTALVTLSLIGLGICVWINDDRRAKSN